MNKVTFFSFNQIFKTQQMTMKIKNLAWAVLFVCSFTMIACGGGTTDTTTENTDSLTTTTTETPETATSEAGDKSTCGTTTISFDNPTVKGAGFEIKTAEAKFYMMSSEGKQYPSIIIFFANYAKEGSYVQDPATPDQRRIMVTFNGLLGTKDLGAVEYSASSKGFGAELNASTGIQSGEGMGYLNNASGNAVITYIGADKICGTADIKGSDGTFIKGNFSVPLTR